MICNYYTVYESIDKNATNTNFQLHNHDEYEIYMFLDGDSKYVVEEKVYTLKPGDIIIIRKHEMHRVYHNKSAKYHRIFFWIYPEFFAKHNCEEYEKAFLNISKKTGNKIDADIVHSSGLYDAIMRLKKYSDNLNTGDTPIADSIIIEILYIINKISTFSYSDASVSPVKEIIAYINSNFTGDITLEELAEKFFISKYYLCRIFKKATGLTVQGYIKHKRLTHMRELYSTGINLTEAAMLSGFKDYSSFYRTYVNEYGTTPKSGFLNK